MRSGQSGRPWRLGSGPPRGAAEDLVGAAETIGEGRCWGGRLGIKCRWHRSLAGLAPFQGRRPVGWGFKPRAGHAEIKQEARRIVSPGFFGVTGGGVLPGNVVGVSDPACPQATFTSISRGVCSGTLGSSTRSTPSWYRDSIFSRSTDFGSRIDLAKEPWRRSRTR